MSHRTNNRSEKVSWLSKVGYRDFLDWSRVKSTCLGKAFFGPDVVHQDTAHQLYRKKNIAMTRPTHCERLAIPAEVERVVASVEGVLMGGAACDSVVGAGMRIGANTGDFKGLGDGRDNGVPAEALGIGALLGNLVGAPETYAGVTLGLGVGALLGIFVGLADTFAGITLGLGLGTLLGVLVGPAGTCCTGTTLGLDTGALLGDVCTGIEIGADRGAAISDDEQLSGGTADNWQMPC
jgi:hypothetical protein